MEHLNYLSVARVSGRDAGRFLQAQLTADIAALAEGQSTFACYCDPNGRVAALLLIARRRADFLAVASADLMPSLLKKLRVFVLRDDVDMALLDHESMWGLTESDSPHSALEVLEPAGVSLRYAVGKAGENAGPTPSGDWKRLELLNGIAWLDPQTTGQFLPQMLGLDRAGAVSFSKGCFPGQEIIARTRYLGKLKRFPAVLQIEGSPGFKPGDRLEILQNEAAAEAVVIDLDRGQDNVTVALVVGRHDPERPITQVIVEGSKFRVL